jgi:hypothetical protein
MKYLINATLHADKTPADFLARIHGSSVSTEGWELLRQGIITTHGFKIGPQPGFFLVMEADSEAAAQAAISAISIVQEGWFDIAVDPISPFLFDMR